MRVGVLALQGDFDAHRRRLAVLGAEVVLVRNPEELDSVDALIIPGGESTTFLRLLERERFLEKLRQFVHIKPTFGTCAGAILLAADVKNPAQPSLAALDISVLRNAYGRQVNSFIGAAETIVPGGPLEAVYIRAPRIERVGQNVDVLAKQDGAPVWVRQGNIMAATFHPELSHDTRVHAMFLKMAEEGQQKR